MSKHPHKMAAPPKEIIPEVVTPEVTVEAIAEVPAEIAEVPVEVATPEPAERRRPVVTFDDELPDGKVEVAKEPDAPYLSPRTLAELEAGRKSIARH